MCVDHRNELQRKGITSPCLASVLIEDINTKYGETPEAAFYKTIAKNLSGVSYAGTSTVNLSILVCIVLTALNDAGPAGADTVRTP